MVDEKWKIIDGYDGKYEISNYGLVKNKNFKRSGFEKLLALRTVKGYIMVGLYKNGKQKLEYVHRLVGKYFLENTFNYPEINHKDECKSNNCVENLEWCDRTYNINYGTAVFRCGKSKSKPILQYDLDGGLVKRWDRIRDAGRNGYNSSTISKCCRNIKHTHKGYVWKYED